MGAGRGIDHVGIASRDLDGLAAVYEGLGFTLTPRAFHKDEMGTSNRLVQLRGRNFIELVEVDRPQTMLPHAPGFMGFGTFVHDFLERREGLSLIVFRTDDAAADLAAWKAKGLKVYNQFNFERLATLPDGRQVTVSFELGIVTDPAMPEILYFVCHNRAEEHFWKPAFQEHANGAQEIEAVVLCAAEPERHGGFLAALFDGDMATRDGGISVSFAGHRIDVVTPDALVEHGWADRPPYGEAQAAGLVIRAPGRAGTITQAPDAGGAFIEWAT